MTITFGGNAVDHNVYHTPSAQLQSQRSCCHGATYKFYRDIRSNRLAIFMMCRGNVHCRLQMPNA